MVFRSLVGKLALVILIFITKTSNCKWCNVVDLLII